MAAISTSRSSYYKKGLAGQAVAALKASVDKSPENVAFKYHLGFAYAKNGDAAAARQTLETALKLDAKSSQAEEARATLAKLSASGS